MRCSLFSHPAPSQTSLPGRLHSLGDPLVFVSILILHHNVLSFHRAPGFGWCSVRPDDNLLVERPSTFNARIVGTRMRELCKHYYTSSGRRWRDILLVRPLSWNRHQYSNRSHYESLYHDCDHFYHAYHNRYNNTNRYNLQRNYNNDCSYCGAHHYGNYHDHHICLPWRKPAP